jgi:GT2 family glycosyltransferase
VTSERLPSVVALVLNWNNLPDTLECVGSLLRSDYSNLAVWVVDNDSRDDPTSDLRGKHPEIRIVRNTKNLGYGGGNNSGLRLAIAEGAAYVLLLNNDVVVAPDMVSRLVMAVEGDSRIVMATPTVFYYDRPREVYWDGGSIDWETGWVSHCSEGLVVEGESRKSEWLDGCSLLIRGSAISDIGLLDERYFLYFEDAEWSVRAARRGWLNAVVLTAQAWHKVSRSTGGREVPAVRFYYARNRYLFMRSHTPIRNPLKWRVRYAWDMLQEYWSVRHEPEGREAIVAACMSLLRGCWGSYDSRGVIARHLGRVLDALLLLAMKCARTVKRCMLAVSRVARLLVGTAARNHRQR